ncbi:MAG: hypothetical protein IIC01_08900 [Planctomycetes bacterium]|nr:hypothetical protein [Planctomycetota bacterium]
MSYLVDHHLAVVDPFRHGTTALQMGMMMNLHHGMTFPWRDGGVALMRRELYPSPGQWEYCGIAIETETQVKNYPGFTHQVSQAYQYAAVVFLGNGMISAMSEPVRLDFDSNGDLIQPMMPNAPSSVCAQPIAAGQYRVSWEYDPFGHGAFPKDFQVFEGPDAASIDYGTPLTDSITGLSTVAHVGHQRLYSFTTTAFADLSPHAFAARARNSAAVAEINTLATVVKKAHAAAPADAPAPIRMIVGHHSRVGT